ncbi:hypothetical protein CY652_20300 [Burkholderia sp. WAC0059]|uniref:two-partner secretion domain-containing protein n=1 Tax=Burkholderia sp. WAC0059 TaxID=2066022 RepID=UPI000C7ED49B|nr:MBG domain-containing protein [Burkholderia sp. WAC0059]PLZ00633.1 hypothetical protein CY652_20300 [Burkholderia sp. WAC0059]
MNGAWRVVWNASHGVWQVASELARGRGTRGRVRSRARRLAWFALLPLGFPLVADAAAIGATTLPTGGTVASGSARISQNGATLTVSQQSENASLNWQHFNIGSAATVDFVQPNAQSVAVNRIAGNSGSVILGHLNANGQIYLINPNGVLFGPGAQVNVGALVASTLDVGDDSIGTGTQTFSGGGTGSVENLGTIRAAPGGYVALLGNRVSNAGTIRARLGTVALAGGSAVTLDFAGDGLLSVQVERSTLDALAANGGLIEADGGTVLMSAGAQDALLESAVNNTGVIDAQTVQNRNGTITLLAGRQAGSVEVGGTLDASAPDGGDGGSVETSGAQVQVESGAKITTAAPGGKSGTWLIDPTDFTINAGSAAQTDSGIGASTLEAELASGDVEIETSSAGSGNGDIDVDAAVTWNANATLVLEAANNINVNAPISVKGINPEGAGLMLNAGNDVNVDSTINATNAVIQFYYGSGGNLNVGMNAGGFTGQVNLDGTDVLVINGQSYTIITSLGTADDASTGAATLEGIAYSGNLSGYYALGGNLDASATSSWGGGSGFIPIGSSGEFDGVFDGLGHVISNLTENGTGDIDEGLFGQIADGIVRNVGLENATVSGAGLVGALAGWNHNGQISNVWTTGTVTGTGSGAYDIGGLVGSNGDTAGSGVIDDAWSSATVAGGSGSYGVGGLVGENTYTGTISDAYASGAVSGYGSVGGLVGGNTGQDITDAWATGSVSGTQDVGGLIGSNQYEGGVLEDVYASGAVSGNEYVGGLVGDNYGVPISDAYATGPVTGTGSSPQYLGGLVGDNEDGGTISDTYASGAVTGGGQYVGGLLGYNDTTGGDSAISGSYWDTTATGQGAAIGGGTTSGSGIGTTGLTTQQWFTSGPVASGAWSASNGWAAGYPYPVLSALPYIVITGAGTETYGNTASLAASVTAATDPSGNDATSLVDTSDLAWIGSATGTSDVGGGYLLGGIGATAAGYQVAYDGALTVEPAALTITASNQSKTYGQSANPGTTAFTVSGLVNGDAVTGVTLSSSGAAATADAGQYALDAAGATGSGLSNYTIAYDAGTLTVDPAPLTVAANDASVPYSGVAYRGGDGVAYRGFVNGETPAALGGTLTYSGSSQGAVAAGTYALIPGGLVSDNYTIDYVGGQLTIEAAPPTIGALSVDSVSFVSASSALSSALASSSTIGPGVAIGGLSLIALSASVDAHAEVVNVVQPIAGNGTLQVVDGGLNLSGVTQTDASVEHSSFTSWRLSCRAY